MAGQKTPSTMHSYPKYLLFFILVGSVILSFTPYWSDITTLYDNKRFFVIFYLLVTAILILLSSSLRETTITSILTLSRTNKTLILIALIGATIANFTSLYWVKSQAVITYILMLFLTTTLLSTVVLQYKHLIYRIYIWLTFTLFLSVFLFHIIATWQDLIPNYRYIFSFVNPRLINHVQIWMILPLLYWSWIHKNKPKPWLYSIPAVFQFSLLYALDARGAFIASLGGIVLWISLTENKVEKIKWTLILISCGLAIKWLLFTPLPQIIFQGGWPEGQGEIRLSDSSRLKLWYDAVAMISFWGLGGDSFVCSNNEIANSPHNLVLQIAVEWGIIPAICYITLLLRTFCQVYKTWDETVRLLGITVLSGFAYSFVSSPLNTPLSQGLAMISVALFWATINNQVKLQNQSYLNITTKSKSKFLHIILICISIWSLLFIGYKSYIRVENNQYRHIKLDYYKPQFWIEHNCIDTEPEMNIIN